MGLSIDGLGKLMLQQGNLEGLVLVLGVKDEAKADRLLGVVVDMLKKEELGAPPIEATTSEAILDM